MKISSRLEYGMTVMLELARDNDRPVQIKKMAGLLDVTSKYLEQIIAILRTAGLVESVRGPLGGYILTREPEDITVKDMLLALEGPLFQGRPTKPGPITDVFEEIAGAVLFVARGKTLAEMVRGHA